MTQRATQHFRRPAKGRKALSVCAAKARAAFRQLSAKERKGSRVLRSPRAHARGETPALFALFGRTGAVATRKTLPYLGRCVPAKGAANIAPFALPLVSGCSLCGGGAE
jgi:hypothetical protein